MATPFKVNHFGAQVVPMSLTCGWTTINNSASTANDPGDLSGASALPVLSRGNGFGTNIRVRLLYDNAATSITTQCQYRLFGRDARDTSLGGWHPLPNKNGDYVVTLVANPATDYDNGDQFIAEGDPLDYTHDCDGCDEFVLFITQGLDHSAAGDDGQIQVKII